MQDTKLVGTVMYNLEQFLKLVEIGSELELLKFYIENIRLHCTFVAETSTKRIHYKVTFYW